MPPEQILFRPAGVLDQAQREHHFELNAVGWHQDIAFDPHTNYNLLAISTYLEETAPEHDPRPCPIPPDWSAGYPKPFDQQSGAERDKQSEADAA